jgi:hypothetical protein
LYRKKLSRDSEREKKRERERERERGGKRETRRRGYSVGMLSPNPKNVRMCLYIW